MTDIKAHFGRNLVRLRREAELSQAQLGVLAGMHVSSIQKMELGDRAARLDTLVKLKCSLGVTADELLAGLEWSLESYVQYGGFRIVDADPPR